ncbi:glycosyltransferase [Bradyrhizobium sp. F1.13.3]|uniref:glycosyltransferase n=1 Tax=Bradyrhizobium sp. F1.13.3 TaxID=3156351 RepID=UPI003398496E
MVDIAIKPLRSEANHFVGNFANCLQRNGYSVGRFEWRSFYQAKTVILHWPDEFFKKLSFRQALGCVVKLLLMRLGRAVRGSRFIWVAHNVQPHENPWISWRTTAFLKSLDGIIFLSHFSERAVRDLHQLPADLQVLVTVHGNYRENMVSSPEPARALSGAVRLVQFGQIRRYKNVEKLVEAVTALTEKDIRLDVVGRGDDVDYIAQIRLLAEKSKSVRINITDHYIADSDLERHIDDADGVVLTYRNILNSGSVFLALSRNRPVLAPRLGSLPEMRDQIGEDWLYLYDGEIDHLIVGKFVEWLRIRKQQQYCDLSAFSWTRVGDDLSGFIRSLHA